MKIQIVEIAMALITAAGGFYTLAQGYSDGKSGGITSSNGNGSPEANTNTARGFLDAITALDLEIKPKRKPRGDKKSQAEKPVIPEKPL